MKTAGVIGWPVTYSQSPRIHRFWLEALGLDGDYARFAVAPEQLAAAMQALPALGLAGVNVTVPHKIAVMDFLDEVTEDAAAVRAVNTVLVQDGRLIGGNTDVDGFLEPVRDLPVRHAAVIGAGGAARAVLAGLKHMGVQQVSILNRSLEKAEALLQRSGLTGEVWPLEAGVPAVDLLVNASSLGMNGYPELPFDLGALPPSASVYDIVYAPLETRLLQMARARGLRCIDGLRMLLGQAAPAFEHFYGAAPPRARDQDLRAILLAART